MKKNKELYYVKCKHRMNAFPWCEITLNGGGFICYNMIGDTIPCSDPFTVTWTKFLIYKSHLEEV